MWRFVISDQPQILLSGCSSLQAWWWQVAGLRALLSGGDVAQHGGVADDVRIAILRTARRKRLDVGGRVVVRGVIRQDDIGAGFLDDVAVAIAGGDVGEIRLRPSALDRRP